MLSIKIIDVMTASIDKQKTKIVSSNDLLDAVEPLTLEMLGEEAVYVKQNTVFSQQNTPAPQPAPSQTRSVSKSNAASSTSSENPN